MSAGSVGLPAVPEPPDHDVRAVLAIVPFRRLWLALGLSSFGDWLGLLATTSLAGALATGTSGKLLAVSGVFILRLAPAVLFGPLAGVVADRLDRRWTLVYGDVLRFVLFCTIPLVGTLWWLFVATILIEIVGLFWMPAKEATMPNLVPRNRLEAANQLSLVVTYGSAPIAAVVFSGLTLASGVIDEVVPAFAGQPTYLALYVNALTFLVSAIVIWRLDFPPPTKAARQESLWRTAVEGWRYVGTTPLVRGLVLGMLGAFAAGGTVIGLAQAYVADLKAGSPGYGTLFAAVFVGLALGMWVGPRLLGEFSRRRLFGLSIAAAGGWLVLLSLVPNMVLAVFLTVGLGACAGVAWVTGYTLLGLEVGDEVRGRTFAFLLSMVRVVLVSVLALGPAIAALLSQTLSLPHTLRINEHVALTYTGVMATFLLAGLAAIAVGVASFRQMDDRAGVTLRADFSAALRARKLTDAPSRRAQTAGVFVAFEGGDGAGKSTQVRLLGDWLQKQGYEVLLTHEPGATPTGARLRELLLKGEPLQARAEALLFAADRAQHVEVMVRPALERGAVVVTDRYIDSSVAYQGSGRDLGAAEVAQLSRWATGGLEPDLTVLLDVAPDVGRDRRQGADDRLEAEPDEFHSSVREQFLQLARRAPSRYLVLDAAGQPDELARAVVTRLAPLLPESPVARVAREQRLAREQAAQRAEEERVQAAMQRLADDRSAAERAEVERLARVQAALEQAARDKAVLEQAAGHREPAHPAVSSGATAAPPGGRPPTRRDNRPIRDGRERAASDTVAEKFSAHERVAQAQAARDRAAREKAAAEQAAREQASRKQAARDEAARELAAAPHQAAGTRQAAVEPRPDQQPSAARTSLRQATTAVVPVVQPTAPLPVAPTTDARPAGSGGDLTRRVPVPLPDDNEDAGQPPGLDDEIFGFGTGRGTRRG